MPYTSLNALVSNGRELWALCHSMRPAAEKALCHPRQPWRVMSFARRAGRIVVGSEPLDGGKWARFKPSEFLRIRPQGRTLRIERFPV